MPIDSTSSTGSVNGAGESSRKSGRDTVPEYAKRSCDSSSMNHVAVADGSVSSSSSVETIGVKSGSPSWNVVTVCSFFSRRAPSVARNLPSQFTSTFAYRPVWSCDAV